MCLIVTRSLHAYFKIQWVVAQELRCCAAVLPVCRTHLKDCLPFASEPGRSSQRLYPNRFPSKWIALKSPPDILMIKMYLLTEPRARLIACSQSEACDPSLDSYDHDGLRERLLSKLRLSLKEEDVDLLEELFVREGIIFDPETVVLDIDSACHDVATQQMALLVEAVEELTETVQELTDENEKLRHQLEVAQEVGARAHRTASEWSGGLLFGFVPAAILRRFGFVPD